MAEQEVVKRRFLTREEKKDIIMSHMLDRTNKNIKALQAKYHITKQGIYQMIKREKGGEIYNECINEMDANFKDRCAILIEKALMRIENDIENEDKEINISQLATLTGILYDKSRLEKGLSTENKAISVNINID